MELEKLINCLETAKQKLGPNTKVFIYTPHEDKTVIEDIVLKVEHSLLDMADDSKVLIYI